MAILSVTRLRLTTTFLAPKLIWVSSSVIKQARSENGFLAGKIISGDFLRVFFTVTLWTELAPMHRFVASGAHLKSMQIGKKWCTEMCSVSIERAHHPGLEIVLPGVRECEEILRKHGRFTHLARPSQNQIERNIPTLIRARESLF